MNLYVVKINTFFNIYHFLMLVSGFWYFKRDAVKYRWFNESDLFPSNPHLWFLVSHLFCLIFFRFLFRIILVSPSGMVETPCLEAK